MRKLAFFVFAACVAASLASVSQASLISYSAILSGPNESPPNASPGTGTATVDYDDVAHTLHVQATFNGLVGNTTASHIHSATAVPFSGTAGVATTTPFFAGFPIGVTSGFYDNTLNLTLSSSYNPSFVTANGGTTASAELALTGGIAAGKAYFNVHSTVFGGGEIRGFLTPVPEPTALALIGIAAVLIRRRR